MSELRFDHLRSTHPRAYPLRVGILHWTGGIRDAAGFYETMRARKGRRTPDGLSVHHYIDSRGRETQMAAHDLVCLHAGNSQYRPDPNEVSLGIEIANPAYDRLGRDAADIERERYNIVRPERYEPIRGARKVRYLDFTPEQYEAVTLLVERLCDLHGIPRRVPTEPDGSLMRRQMTQKEWERFAGWCGHYHVHPTKNDPGPALLEHLRRRWA